MANLKDLLDDPDFLSLPESEQDSIVEQYKSKQGSGFSKSIKAFGDSVMNPKIESLISGPVIGPATTMAQKFYEKQRGDINNIIPDRLKTGIGSGIREALPITKLVPEKLVSNKQIGNAITPLLVDAAVFSATPGGGKLAKTGVEGVASSLESRSAKKMGTAKDVLQRILRPGESVTPEMLEETVPFVKRSKELRDLLQTLKSERYKAGEEKSALIKNLGEKTNESPSFKKAIDFINKKRSEGILPEEKFAPLEEALRKEVDIVKSYPKEQLTPQFFDERKMAFQDYAEKLYGKDPSPDSQLVKQLWKDIASDYRGIVEGFDPRVASANRRASGLIQSTDLLEKRANQSVETSTRYDKSTPKKILETVVSRIPGVDQILYGRRRFESIMNEPKMDIPFMTKTIEKNYKASTRSKKMADILRELTSNTPRIGNSGQRLLPEPEPKLLGVDRRSFVGNRLQDTSSGKTINIPESGRSPIAIPDVLESEKQALMNKWGVPERNIRETISSSDIEPVIKSSSIDTSLNPDKRTRSFIKQIMERRKRNFGA